MASALSLIVGLGNPGREYAQNRHNLGFMVVDELAREARVELKKRFSGQFAKAALNGHDCALLEPETFMNESGRSVQGAASFFHLKPSEVLVIHDELDLPFGEVRVKQGGGHAGHNGLRSIIQCLGSAEFVRLRVGIGKPPPGFGGDTADFVLGNFVGSERAALDGLVRRAADATLRVLSVGVERAMNELNARPKSPPKPARGGASGAGGTEPGGAGPSTTAPGPGKTTAASDPAGSSKVSSPPRGDREARRMGRRGSLLRTSSGAAWP